MQMQLMEDNLASSATSASTALPSMFTEPDIAAPDGNTPDVTVSTSSRGGRYLYVDFLEWMGDIMSASQGRISCPNTSCR